MNVMPPPNPSFHIRPAQAGDVCVLLEPIDVVEITHLAEKQQILQAQFGGSIVTPVHLTCARFTTNSPQQEKALIAYLGANLNGVKPFSLTTFGVQTLDLSHINTRVLKWRVGITEALNAFVALLEEAIVYTGATSLYAPGVVSSLVSALFDVPNLTPADLNRAGVFPYTLYTANKIVFSKIEDKNRFNLLETITF